jgi:hypothetical protein
MITLVISTQARGKVTMSVVPQVMSRGEANKHRSWIVSLSNHLYIPHIAYGGDKPSTWWWVAYHMDSAWGVTCGLDEMSLHWYPVKPFIDLRATLRKGRTHEATLIHAWYGGSSLVSMWVQLYTYIEIFSKAWSLRTDLLVVLSSRLRVVLMMELDDEMIIILIT